MIITGLDLSLVATGLVTLKNGELVNQVLIKSKPSGKKPIDELKRILDIKDEILHNIQDSDLIVIEGMAYAIRNTTSLVQLAALNYLTREGIYDIKKEFVIVAPTSLKKFITGKGNSGKDIMLLETYKRYGVSFDDNNIADAFSLAKVGEALYDKTIKLIKPQIEVIKLLKEQL